MNGLLALAFGAGLIAPVSPCGFAVLPVFLAQAAGVGDNQEGGRSGTLARLTRGLRAGAAVSLGFAGTFAVIGLLLATGLRSFVDAVPWLAVVLGAIMAILGIAMLSGWHLPLRLAIRGPGTPRTGTMGTVVFGAGYAIASASCTVAVLLAVVTQAAAVASVSGVVVMFAAYAAGSATLLICLAVFAAFASALVSRHLRRLLPHMNWIGGGLLALSGGYLLVYWLPQLLGDAQAGRDPLTGIAGAVSGWITEHQLIVVISVAGLVVTTLVALLVVRRWSDGTAEDSSKPTLN